jgi:hypothetical protein
VVPTLRRTLVLQEAHTVAAAMEMAVSDKRHFQSRSFLMSCRSHLLKHHCMRPDYHLLQQQQRSKLTYFLFAFSLPDLYV